MQRFNIFLFLILIFSFISPLSARTVRGTVLSASDSTALAGAECRLLDGAKAVAGCTSDAEGSFSLDVGGRSALMLEIGFTGFRPTEIRLASGSRDVELGVVYLEETTVALGEVTVTAASVTDSRGRTVIYPEASVVRASSTPVGLFQKLPLAGLEANPVNRTISVDGGTPVILINGVPSTIDDFNALMPGDIARIEYSRVTPARYADSGKSGLVSITLKARTDGGQVYLWGRSAVTTAFMDGNFRASYHQGPSQFTLSYNPSWRNYNEVYDHTVESYIGHDFRVDLEESDRNPFNYHYHQMTAKYDYSPDEATLFSATFRAMPQYIKRRKIGRAVDSESGGYDYLSNMSTNTFAPSLDLFFRRNFNSRNSLEVQVVGTLSSNDYRRVNEYDYDNGPESEYGMDVDSRRRSLISEVSYNHDFSAATSLSGGFQNTLSRSTNTYLTSDYKPVLTENNNYVYARMGQQIGKVYMSVSTGLKMFWIKNDLNRRDFIRNRTVAQLTWNIGRDWSLSAAFAYGPQIPTLSQLTDYPQQVSPYLVVNGSPALKVADSFTYQAMPGFRHGKFSTSLLLTYRHVADAVIDDIVYMGDEMFLSQSVNARRSRSFESNLNFRLSDLCGFGANVNLGVSHYDCAGDVWSNRLTSFRASFTLWWNRGPYTVSYWRKVPGKYLSGHYVGKEENGDALSFEWKPDKHWTLGASWMYMFDVKGTRYPSWSLSAVNPSCGERYIKHNGNMVVLSASYNVDFGSIFRSGRRSLNNSDSGSSLLTM